jgi:UDP-glucuronate 4-epimerase
VPDGRPERVLVTGAAGFIGAAVAERLLSEGRAVQGIDNFAENYPRAVKESNLARLAVGSEFRFAEADVSDREAVLELFSRFRPDAVVHMAGLGNVRASVASPRPYVLANVVGTNNVLEAAVRAEVQNVVFASTSSVYGQRHDVPFRESDATDRPLAPYPATKKACELLGHAFHVSYSLSFTALRFFNVYGPRGRPDMMPWITLESLVHDRPITVFAKGELRRDWTYIDDVVAGVVAALDRPLGYEVLNIGRGQPFALNDFIAIFERLEGRAAKRIDAPRPTSDPEVTFADVSKAREMLDYQPTVELPDGLERFRDWWKATCMSSGGD